MNSLPTTSPEHYLTGTSAMAIPSAETSYVNWHFVDTFLGGKAAFRVAGVNFPDTSHFLGSFGIRECGEILRRLGAPLEPQARFYAADRDRALLDLILNDLRQGRRPDHLRIEDYCDNLTDFDHLKSRAASLRHHLTDGGQIQQLEEWLALQ